METDRGAQGLEKGDYSNGQPEIMSCHSHEL